MQYTAHIPIDQQRLAVDAVGCPTCKRGPEHMCLTVNSKYVNRAHIHKARWVAYQNYMQSWARHLNELPALSPKRRSYFMVRGERHVVQRVYDRVFQQGQGNGEACLLLLAAELRLTQELMRVIEVEGN